MCGCFFNFFFFFRSAPCILPSATVPAVCVCLQLWRSFFRETHRAIEFSVIFFRTPPPPQTHSRLAHAVVILYTKIQHEHARRKKTNLRRLRAPLAHAHTHTNGQTRWFFRAVVNFLSAKFARTVSLMCYCWPPPLMMIDHVNFTHTVRIWIWGDVYFSPLLFKWDERSLRIFQNAQKITWYLFCPNFIFVYREPILEERWWWLLVEMNVRVNRPTNKNPSTLLRLVFAHRLMMRIEFSNSNTPPLIAARHAHKFKWTWTWRTDEDAAATATAAQHKHSASLLIVRR